MNVSFVIWSYSTGKKIPALTKNAWAFICTVSSLCVYKYVYNYFLALVTFFVLCMANICPLWIRYLWLSSWCSLPVQIFQHFLTRKFAGHSWQSFYQLYTGKRNYCFTCTVYCTEVYIYLSCKSAWWKNGSVELCKPFRPRQCCEGLGSCLLMSPMFLPLCALPSYSDKSFGHLWFIFMSVEKCWFGNMNMTFKVWNIIS